MSRNEVILFVDDEVNFLSAMRRILRREPYKAIFTSDPHEALKIIEKDSVSVMLTDLRMPKMDGLTLVQKVKEKKPDVVCIIVTAYYEAESLQEAMDSGKVFCLIKKPWHSATEVKDAIRKAIEHKRSRAI
ncbi:MAG: hypothetical protein DRG40_00190 [Deltaproteobacteria bacterium]|nr:MAG: hypothetical protein DRG40_00190 [Deltaproteobacteria bacterium]